MAAAAQSLVDSFIAELRQEEPTVQRPLVDIATSPSSALCRAALLLLEDLGIAYRELVMGRDITEAQLVRRKGGPFVLLPLIFVDQRFLGGYTELKALAAAGADAVLSAGKRADAKLRGSRTPLRAESPPIFDRLYYEAEVNDARRAALQRHGLEHGLHSPMSPEREPPATRPQSPTVRPSFNSPGRELVSQERSGAGIRAVIQTDRSGMRYDSVHSAVRCGGGWESIERDGNRAHRSRSPAYFRRDNVRHSPARTPGPVLSLGDTRRERIRRTAARTPGPIHRFEPEHEPKPKPEPELGPQSEPEPEPELESQLLEQEEIVRIQQRVQTVGDRLTGLGSGVHIGTSLTPDGAVPLVGMDGEIITSVPPLGAGGGKKLHLLLRLLEGACDRVAAVDDGDG